MARNRKIGRGGKPRNEAPKELVSYKGTAVRRDFTLAVYKGIVALANAGHLKAAGRRLRAVFNAGAVLPGRVVSMTWAYATGGKRIEDAYRDASEQLPYDLEGKRFGAGLYGALPGALLGAAAAILTYGAHSEAVAGPLAMVFGGGLAGPLLLLQGHSIVHTGKFKTEQLEKIAERQRLEDRRAGGPA